MKLSELKEIAKECGYEFEERAIFDKDYFFKNNRNVIKIRDLKEGIIWINNSAFYKGKDFKMLEACIEFAKTPLEEREDILDDVEHEYLSEVIRPFRNRVEHIEKRIVYKEICYNYIYLKLKDDYMHLPIFKAGTMYKNMELNKNYTLEELGL